MRRSSSARRWFGSEGALYAAAQLYLFIGCLAVCPPAFAQSNSPDQLRQRAIEILEHLGAKYRARPSVAMDISVRTEYPDRQAPDAVTSTRTEVSLRRDGDRFDADVERFRTLNRTEVASYAHRSFWDGVRQFHRQQNRQPGSNTKIDASLSGSPSDVRAFENSTELAPYLDGVLPGDESHFSEILLSPEAQMEVRELRRPEGGASLVIRSDLPTGEYTIQLSSEPPYFLEKATLRRGEEHLIDGRPLESGDRILSEISWEITIGQYDSVDGIPLATRGTAECFVKLKDGRSERNVQTVERRNVQWNPDFDLLGAFKIDLPRGTILTDDRAPGLVYVWEGNGVAPFVDDRVLAAIADAVDAITRDEASRPRIIDLDPTRSASVDLPIDSDPESAAYENARSRSRFWNATTRRRTALFLIIGLIGSAAVMAAHQMMKRS